MNARSLTFSLFLAFFLFLFSGCVKDKFEDIEVTYNGTLAFPVAQVGFTLEEVLDNDTLFVIDGSNAIDLVYRNEDFYTLSAEEFLDDITGDLNQEQTETFNIGNVDLDGYSVQRTTTFGEIIEGFNSTLLYDFFLQNDGNAFPIPAFSEEIGSVLSVPAFGDFSSIEIEEGKLILTVTNNLFFEVENFGVTIIDNTTQNEIGTVVFPYVAIGQTVMDEVDLAGKTVGNDFRLETSQFETPGTGTTPVTIDLDATLFVSAEITDLVIKSGEVSLPPGTYDEGDYTFQLDLEEDERIYTIELDNGQVDFTINSDFNAAFNFRMVFPDIIKNGSPVEHEIEVPANSGNPVVGTLDFSNTVWYLDQNTDTPYNQLKVSYEIFVPQSTPGQIMFSADDEVSFQMVVSNIEPSLVTGHFGQKMETIEPGELDLGFDFDIFDEASSPIYFENPTIWVDVQNSFGVPLALNFNATATGQFGGQAMLNPPNPLNINYPDISMVDQMVETNFIFNKNNSDIVDMLAIYPNNIIYEGSATANPENNMQEINFVSSKSELSATAEIVLPFQFRAENLIYTNDGEAIDFDLDEGLTIDDIDSAVLKVIYLNELPLSAEFQINTIDELMEETTVISGVALEAGTPNNIGRVEPENAAQGEIYIRLSREQIMQLDEASKNIYRVIFKTPNDGQMPAAMYTDYNVDLNLGMTVTFDR